MPIPALPLPSEEEPLDSSSQVAWLRSLGDRDALFQVMDGDRYSIQSLEAAEALVQLGDVRGLDHLIATLNNPGSRLRMEAAEILQQLHHPRAMRALRERQTETQSSERVAQREEVYEDMNAATTDELIAIWYQDDRARWTNLELEVVESILLERLGKLPRRAIDSDEGADIDEDVDPRIRQLWKDGDADGLMHVFERNPGVLLQFEAAEALADLGSEDALDFLVRMLDDADEENREVAAEMLDWLDLPHGNAALRDRGYEFETGRENLIELPHVQAPERAAPGTEPPRQATWWGTTEPQGKASWISRVPTMPGETRSPAPQEQSGSPGASFGVIATGAFGGVIGFLCVLIGLDLVGFRLIPDGWQEWFQPALVYALIESVVVGGAAGTVGRRAARAMAARAGEDVDEQDARLVLGALISGAAAAFAVGLLRFVLGD